MASSPAQELRRGARQKFLGQLGGQGGREVGLATFFLQCVVSSQGLPFWSCYGSSLFDLLSIIEFSKRLLGKQKTQFAMFEIQNPQLEFHNGCSRNLIAISFFCISFSSHPCPCFYFYFYFLSTSASLIPLQSCCPSSPLSSFCQTCIKIWWGSCNGEMVMITWRKDALWWILVRLVWWSFMIIAGVSILTSYKEKPPVKKLPIFSEFIENSAKFIKNSGLTKWTQNLR